MNNSVQHTITSFYTCLCLCCIFDVGFNKAAIYSSLLDLRKSKGHICEFISGKFDNDHDNTVIFDVFSYKM